MDIAVVGAGASVTLDDAKQTIVSARISLAAVAPTPLFAEEASARLAGREVSDAAIDDAAQAAQAIARPISDMRGTAEQRTHLVGVPDATRTQRRNPENPRRSIDFVNFLDDTLRGTEGVGL